MLVSLLVKIVSRGGNLIMNVGPTARGFLDYRAEDALKVYGEWMKYNCKSIYNCTMADPEFTEPNGCRLTQSNDGTKLFIHLLDYPFRSVVVPGLGGKIDYAQFLHDGSELLFSDVPASSEDEAKTAASISLPILKPNVVVPVIEVFLK